MRSRRRRGRFRRDPAACRGSRRQAATVALVLLCVRHERRERRDEGRLETADRQVAKHPRIELRCTCTTSLSGNSGGGGSSSGGWWWRRGCGDVAMMNRRTLVRAHSHWRPRGQAATGPRIEPAPSPPKGSHRRWAAVVVAIASVAIAGLLITRGPSASRLPGTPVAWLDSFSAAVAREPGKVCSQLVSPTFRTALERDVPQVVHRVLRPGARSLDPNPEGPSERRDGGARGALLAARWLHDVRARPAGRWLAGGRDRSRRTPSDLASARNARNYM
jgi:hypothetical protein